MPLSAIVSTAYTHVYAYTESTSHPRDKFPSDDGINSFLLNVITTYQTTLVHQNSHSKLCMTPLIKRCNGNSIMQLNAPIC